MQKKSALRQYFRERRRSVSSVFREQAANQFLCLVCHHNILGTAKMVACYLSQDGELDITSLIEYCWQHLQSVCLPVIGRETLVFKRYQRNTDMKRNTYGILEPSTDEIVQPDLVFLPLVAFDRVGHRLGMGKGFYDKTFQHLRPKLIGVAYACQEAASLPVDAWDVPLDAIITETEYIAI